MKIKHFELKNALNQLLLVVILSFSLAQLSIAQNGHILSRVKVDWKSDSLITSRISKAGVLKDKYQWLETVLIEKITYESDGLEVVGYLAQPIEKDEYPCVIYNRGGNKEFGKLSFRKALFILGKLAAQGYVVAGSQYRGNDGGEGKEEFGGADVYDIINLLPTFEEIAVADTSRIGIYGWSRGGMMTYLTLSKTDRFKAAVVGGGVSDLYMVMETRTDTFETVYEKNIPNYTKNKKAALDQRSIITHVEDLPKTTPILIVHGTADWRVVPQMALELSAACLEHQIPHRLVMFEGGDHGLSEFDNEVDQMVFDWFDKYLRDETPAPVLAPHGR